MADWFIILSIVVASILLLISGLYFLIYYQHPDDRNEAWFPKLTVLLGFVLAGATVLLLPLDVANNDGYFGCHQHNTSHCKGLNMNVFWNIFYWAIPVWVLIIIPFMTFFYEGDSGTLMTGTAIGSHHKSRLCEAMKYEFGVVTVIGTLFTVAYLFLNESVIPVMDYEGNTNTSYVELAIRRAESVDNFLIPYLFLSGQNNHEILNPTLKEINITVSITTFLGRFMAFLGWWVFALFGGIGMAALPLNRILTFVHRPRLMSTAEMADAKLSIRTRVNELVDIGEHLKVEKALTRSKQASRYSRSGRREEQKLFLNFKKAVYLLEEDVEDFMLCTENYKEYNPLVPFFSLILGLCFVILSVTWLIQISIFVLPKKPIHPFLNTYFQWFDNWFPLFGVLSVALYAVYLLLCAVNGCFTFGLRFLFLQLHPMKVGKTYMSSFMFNIGLILLCALPVVQFCANAFSEYARYTYVYQIMGIQIEYMKFFQWFWNYNIFVIFFVIITGLTTFYLAFKPHDSKGNALEFRDRLKSRRL